MYLQSAEIRNFRGIRHLTVDFEKDTSVLIGENAWGKSSLLYALFMILGCGSNRLCRFSHDDLYVPIKLESDTNQTGSDNANASDVAASATAAAANTVQQSSQAHDDDTATPELPHFSDKQLGQAFKKLAAIRESFKFTSLTHDGDLHIFEFRGPEYDAETENDCLRVSLDQDKFQALKENLAHDYKQSLNAFCEIDEDSKLGDRAPLLSRLQNVIDAEACQDDSGPCYDNPSSADMLRHAQDFLSEQDSLNHEARRTAQEDVNFYSSDVYQEETDSIVIDLIFCETSHGVLNRIDRFATVRPFAYESDDGRACVHYRISAAAKYIEPSNAVDSKSHIPESRFITTHELIDGKGQSIANAKDGIYDLIALNPLLRLRDRRMFSSSPRGEDDPFCSCPDQGPISDDVVVPGYDSAAPSEEYLASLQESTPTTILNGAKLNAATTQTINETNSANGDSAPKAKGQACLEELQDEISSDERRTISQLFSFIDEEGGLKSGEVSEALSVLNTIASKYLTNYQSPTQVYNKTQHHHPRTAREIISHPVSVASLSSLKKAIADSKPSSTKFLLSIVAGALLMSKGERKFDEYARPILLLEDVESRFHPTLLLNFWSILQVLPTQKIITTNSSQLISAISLHNLRRLSKQYYDVRCYKVRDRAFSADDERKISFHVRMSRPASVFARCWILVEGETEVWMLNEIASVLGINLGCNGIKLIEFAQCGLNPLIKLARQLGIAFHVLTDGDTAGQHYASTVREFTGGRHLSEHLSVMPHVDIEHYLYASGFADVYQKAAGLTTKQVSERQMQAMMNKLGVPEIIAMASDGQSFEQIADTAATNLEHAEPDPHRRDHYGHHYANANRATISRTCNPQHGNITKTHVRPRPAQNHNLESIIASIKDVNFGAHKQLLMNVIHRGKTQGKNKKAQVFDIKELTVNDVQTLYKYLRSLVEDMPRPSHNFTPKQSRMLKAIKAVCGILSGIANTNKQRFSSRLRKYDRQKAKHHYKASHVHAENGLLSDVHDHYDSIEEQEPIIQNYDSAAAHEYTSDELTQSNHTLQTVPGDDHAALSSDSSAAPEAAAPTTAANLEGGSAAAADAIVPAAQSQMVETDSADGSEESEISQLLSASDARDNKEAILKIKAMADEAMMHERDHNRIKQFERSTGKAANAIYGALNEQELQRQGLSMNKVIEHAIKKKTKPGMAILVGEAMQKRGKDSVPLMFKTMFRKISRMASNEYGLR